MKTELVRNFSSYSITSVAACTSFTSNDSDHEEPEPDICSKVLTKKNFLKRFPICSWLPHYTGEKFLADTIAGISVGLTMLPQALAYAVIAGLPPQYGLYSGFVGSFIYIFLGSTAEVNIGPTAVVAIITYTYTHGKPKAYAIILTLLTGIVTLFMGIFQLGFIVNFISTPVNSGFTSAAAITICSTQLKSLFGLQFSAEGFLPTLMGTFEHIENIRLADTLLSVVCILILLFLMKLPKFFEHLKKKWVKKALWFISISRNALIVIGGTILAASLSKNPFITVGEITPGLPPVAPPPLQVSDNQTTHSFFNILEEEGSAIIVIPLLAIMEHITIAKALCSGFDPSQEMITIGVANIIGSFFSSIPVTGSFSRTTVNYMSGVKSPMGGLMTGTMVILALWFLTPYFYFIPKASLASVIICAVIFMIDFEVIAPMWRSKKMEFIPWGFTFLISLLIGLEFGMMTGFIISVVYLLYYAARPRVKVMKAITQKGHQFIMTELDRSLTFPSVEYIRYTIRKASRMYGNQYPLVIDCHHIQFADYTAAQGIQQLIMEFKSRDQMLVLWKVKNSLQRILSGVLPPNESKKLYEFCDGGEQELEIFIDSLNIYERNKFYYQDINMED